MPGRAMENDQSVWALDKYKTHMKSLDILCPLWPDKG